LTRVITGSIIAQTHVPVMAQDTPETLAARVLQREHELLPEVLQKSRRAK